jgi:lipopolysaccharide/colanic/teichoic acid biosynthesis glycosyltransferase
MQQEYAAIVAIPEKSYSYAISKQLLDTTGAILGSALFLVTYPAIALAIKLESKGPALVALNRVSEGRVIKLYKFRSMVDGAHSKKSELRQAGKNERADGPFFKMTHDPRLTRVGRLIRKFRLDEIPQFINILKGELSLVGPRPHEPEEVNQYPLEYRHITLAKAGITGLSQVSGASSLPYLKELELDSHYVHYPSLWTDVKIVSKTIAIMLFDPTAV